MSSRVLVKLESHVAEVTLNRPDKFNALDLEMFSEIAAAGEQLAKDSSVRAVVLTGAGEHFCSGIGTSIFQGKEPMASEANMSPGESSPANFFQRTAYVWRELPVPVICVLHGVAYGGGLQIAMGADIRIASPSARLSIMEIKWGLIPDMAITTTLRNILAVDKVKELVFSGRVVDAAEAKEIGLVTIIDDDPLVAARAMAGAIASRSPDAIRAAKSMLNNAWQMPEEEALRREAELQLAIIGRANQLEAVSASLSKRVPEFVDK